MNSGRGLGNYYHDNGKTGRGNQNLSHTQSINLYLREIKEASNKTAEASSQQQQQDNYQQTGKNVNQSGLPPDFPYSPYNIERPQNTNILPPPAFPQPPGFNPAAPSPHFIPFSQPPPHMMGLVPQNMPRSPFPTHGFYNSFPPQSGAPSPSGPCVQGRRDPVQNSNRNIHPQFFTPNNPPTNSRVIASSQTYGHPLPSSNNFGPSMNFQQNQPLYGAQTQNYCGSMQSLGPSQPSGYFSSQLFPPPTEIGTSINMLSTMSGTGSTRDAEEICKIGAQEEIYQWLKLKRKLKMDNIEGTFKNSLFENIRLEKDKATSQTMQESNQVADEEKTSKDLSINEAQNALCNILHALAAVQGELQLLDEEVETADAETWQGKVERLKQLKEAYLKTKHEVDFSQLRKLKRKIDLRRKKRERQKRRTREDNEMEQKRLFESVKKHTAIDAWRSKIQQEYLDQQQTKRMKEAADKTLGKVRREIKEARKMMDTIVRLQKLRDIRSDTAAKRGQSFPTSIAVHFTDKTDDLIQLLVQQIESYENEEAALKLILETEKEEAKEKERETIQRKRKEQQQAELEEDQQSLFGSSVTYNPDDPLQPFFNYYLQSQYSMHSFQHIRHEWDLFLVPESTPMASRIPDGWVIPEVPSSLIWASALQS